MSVKYKIGHFGYYLIHNFYHDKILGTVYIYLRLFDAANCFKSILISELNQIRREKVYTSWLDVDMQLKALVDYKRKNSFFLFRASLSVIIDNTLTPISAKAI